MSHPNSLDLEAFASGDADPRVTAHLGDCEACTRFVERARAFVANAQVFTPRLEIEANAPTRRGSNDASRQARVLRIASYAAPFILAAAGVSFFLRAPGAQVQPPPRESAAPSAGMSAETRALGANDRVAFKGGIQLAIVRDRAGLQERFAGAITVRPGDKIRVELSLDAPGTWMAGVVTSRGEFVVVMEESARDAGTHFSEAALRIDGTQMDGTLVVGSRAAIDAARAASNLDALTTMPITWEAAP